MLPYRDFISRYALMRVFSVAMRFAYVFILGKILLIEDFNKLSIINYSFFACSQIAGFGLHYFYLKKVKSGELNLHTYISTISIFSHVTLVLIGLGTILFLEKDYVVILLFLLFVLIEYSAVEIQRIGQLFDLERVLSILPFWKNLFVILGLSFCYIFFHVDLTVFLLLLIFSGLSSYIIVFGKNVRRFSFQFRKDLFTKRAFINGSFYFSTVALTSIQYLGEKSF
jgi:hypothetical protein